jgi:hypothetical protein
VLCMHLRIFAYTSNTLITSLEYTETMLAAGTLKNFRFLLKSCLSTDRVSVMKLTCSTFHPWRCITVLIALRRDTYWFSVVPWSWWVWLRNGQGRCTPERPGFEEHAGPYDTTFLTVLNMTMNEWVFITTCKQLVWYSRIGRNILICILCYTAVAAACPIQEFRHGLEAFFPLFVMNACWRRYPGLSAEDLHWTWEYQELNVGDAYTNLSSSWVVSTRPCIIQIRSRETNTRRTLRDSEQRAAPNDTNFVSSSQNDNEWMSFNHHL